MRYNSLRTPWVTAPSPTGQPILQLQASFAPHALSQEAATAAAIQQIINQLMGQANMLAIDDALIAHFSGVIVWQYSGRNIKIYQEGVSACKRAAIHPQASAVDPLPLIGRSKHLYQRRENIA